MLSRQCLSGLHTCPVGLVQHHLHPASHSMSAALFLSISDRYLPLVPSPPFFHAAVTLPLLTFSIIIIFFFYFTLIFSLPDMSSTPPHSQSESPKGPLILVSTHKTAPASDIPEKIPTVKHTIKVPSPNKPKGKHNSRRGRTPPKRSKIPETTGSPPASSPEVRPRDKIHALVANRPSTVLEQPNRRTSITRLATPDRDKLTRRTRIPFGRIGSCKRGGN